VSRERGKIQKGCDGKIYAKGGEGIGVPEEKCSQHGRLLERSKKSDRSAAKKLDNDMK